MPNSSQKNTSEQIKIRDLRIKEKYHINDAYLNGFARRCGWKATLVYNSLCRHASRDQFSFPTILQMAEQHSVSRDTIIKGVKSLVKHNLIKVIKKKTIGYKFLNNGYILVDKSEWIGEENIKKENRVAVSDVAKKPRRCERRGSPSNRVAVSDYKDTHIKGYTYKKKKRKKTPHTNVEVLSLLTFFNNLFDRKLSSTKQLENNYRIWIKSGYSLQDMKNALVGVSKDNFWKTKITPTILLRTRNQKGEPVDYIGQFKNMADPAEGRYDPRENGDWFTTDNHIEIVENHKLIKRFTKEEYDAYCRQRGEVLQILNPKKMKKSLPPVSLDKLDEYVAKTARENAKVKQEIKDGEREVWEWD